MFQQKLPLKKALLICDNRHSLNWGCRATSLALIHILESSGYEVSSLSEILNQRDSITRISSISVVNQLSNMKGAMGMTKLIEKIMAKIFGSSSREGLMDIRTLDVPFTVKKLKNLSQKNLVCKQIINAVSDTDTVYINGEGSPIFTNPTRFDLLFQMMIIQLAKDFGKEVAYVNSIISPCPIHGTHEPTVKAFREVTNGISLLTVRDRQSFNFAQDLELSPQKLIFCPDALFAISSHLQKEYSSSYKSIVSSDFATHIEPRINKVFELKSQEYLCLSGASRAPGGNQKNRELWFTNLVKRIQNDFNLPLVIVEPCPGDKFLYDVSQQCNTHFIPASTNIYWGSRILANCAAYITGRYHPSIMASFGGVPQIMLESNSHKTLSLQELLGEFNPQIFPIGTGKETIDLIVEATKKALDNAEADKSRRLMIVSDLARQASTLGNQITIS